MTELEAICEKALYQEVQSLGDGKSLVMDLSSDQLYYRKELSVYSIPVFSWLKEHPHPGLPSIAAFWQQDDKLIVIEEWINGMTLEQLLEEGDLPYAERKRILLAVCEGLSFLHNAQPPIIHRDIKASNIMVSDNGTVKLIDYDAAKVYAKDAKRDTVLIGTQGIAAPEQYGFGASDERTDIYALGKLTERLFPDDAAAAAIAEKATRMEPSDRYARVEQVRAKIGKLKEGAGRRVLPHRLKKFLLPAALAIVLIALWIGLRSCRDPEVPTEEGKTHAAAESTEEQDKTETAAMTASEPDTSVPSAQGESAVPSSTAPEQSTEETVREPSWQATLSLEKGDPLGDTETVIVSALLTGGPEDGETHIRFEIDAPAAGVHLTHTTETVYRAGQTATAMFSAPMPEGENSGQEGNTPAAAWEYEVYVYSDDGDLIGRFSGSAEDKESP